MHLQEDMAKQFVEGYLNKQWIIPVDPAQELLTRTHLIPYLPLILFDFERLREAMDMAVHEFSLRLSGHELQNLRLSDVGRPNLFYSPMLQDAVNDFLRNRSPQKLSNYPIGRCTTITCLARHLLTMETILPATEGFFRLRHFVSSGGIFKVIWGGYKQKFFQTAFQAGDYYIDVANDTVEIHKPKIDHAPLGESGFHNISSYREYVSIKRNYHQTHLFINNCFPELIPYFPLFAYNPGNRAFSFDIDMYMARLNIVTEFRSVFDLYDAGRLALALDKKILEQIKTSVRDLIGGKKDLHYLEFRVMDKEGMTRVLQHAVSLRLPEHVERMEKAEKLCRFLNYIWGRAKPDISEPDISYCVMGIIKKIGLKKTI